MILTTETLVADKPAKEGAAPMGGVCQWAECWYN
jgi:hypothetical protein